MASKNFTEYTPYYDNIKLADPDEFIAAITQKLLLIVETARKDGVQIAFSDTEKKIVELERKLKITASDTRYIYSCAHNFWNYKEVDSFDAAMVSAYVVWDSVCIETLRSILPKHPNVSLAAQMAYNILSGETIHKIVTNSSKSSQTGIYYSTLFKIMDTI